MHTNSKDFKIKKLPSLSSLFLLPNSKSTLFLNSEFTINLSALKDSSMSDKFKSFIASNGFNSLCSPQVFNSQTIRIRLFIATLILAISSPFSNVKKKSSQSSHILPQFFNSFLLFSKSNGFSFSALSSVFPLLFMVIYKSSPKEVSSIG